MSRGLVFWTFIGLAGIAFLSNTVNQLTGWNLILVVTGMVITIIVVLVAILIIGFFQVNRDYRILEGVSDASKK